MPALINHPLYKFCLIAMWVLASTLPATVAHGWQARLPEAYPGTITRLVSHARPGDVIELPPGIYRRESIAFLRSGTADQPIVLRAAKPDTVIVRGSQVIQRWTPIEPRSNIHRHTGWPHWFGPHIPDEGDALGLPRNQLFVDGAQWREVTSIDQLAPQCFYIDPDERSIYLRMSSDTVPSDHVIEVTDTSEPLLTTQGHSHIRIEDIIFEHGANRPQGDALLQIAGGSHCEIINCRVRWAAGAGVSVRGSNHLIRDSRFNHNGQLGLHSARARNCDVVDTELAWNNTHPGKWFNTEWEAGGCKISRSRHFNFLRVHAHHNQGSGIWFDLDNRHASIIDCISHDNGSGIHYEISYTAEIRGNRCYDNLLQKRPRHSPAGQGIYLSSSAGSRVIDNVCFRNATRGIEINGGIRDDGEGREIAPHSNHLHGNVVFDNQRETRGSTDLKIAYFAPQDELPSLNDSLLPIAHNTADHNHYHRDDDLPFFSLPGGRTFQSLEHWQQATGQDGHSIWGPASDHAATE